MTGSNTTYALMIPPVYLDFGALMEISISLLQVVLALVYVCAGAAAVFWGAPYGAGRLAGCMPAEKRMQRIVRA